jgi:hypothetical protein
LWRDLEALHDEGALPNIAMSFMGTPRARWSVVGSGGTSDFRQRRAQFESGPRGCLCTRARDATRVGRGPDL